MGAWEQGCISGQHLAEQANLHWLRHAACHMTHQPRVAAAAAAGAVSCVPVPFFLCPAVVLNVDNSCPNSLRNQEFVKYLFQAQPKGLVTLDFKQNGDYYISCAVSFPASAATDAAQQQLGLVHVCTALAAAVVEM